MPKQRDFGEKLKVLLSDPCHDQQGMDNVVLSALLQQQNDVWDVLATPPHLISEESALGLLKAVELRDSSLLHHGVRAAKYAGLLAGWLHLSSRETQEVVWVGLLHDVGKIGVPDEILKHPGTLELKAFEVMKQHSQWSAELLLAVSAHESLVEGVRFHHERMDRFGYPKGLSGADIPLASRICLLTDSFDAMTSNRAYRAALPLEDAFNEIRVYSGQQFDAGLAKLFLAQMQDLIQSLEQELGIDVLPRIKPAA